MARADQEKRMIEVNRDELVARLKFNREKHIEDYDEAMAGYKSVLLSKIDMAFADAKKHLDKQYEKTRSRILAFTDADIEKQRDVFTLIEDITVEMKVPRSYAKDYDAAIAMAEWDVRKTLELTHAEFTCFVRDLWDWKSGFEAISMIYKAFK